MILIVQLLIQRLNQILLLGELHFVTDYHALDWVSSSLCSKEWPSLILLSSSWVFSSLSVSAASLRSAFSRAAFSAAISLCSYSSFLRLCSSVLSWSLFLPLKENHDHDHDYATTSSRSRSRIHDHDKKTIGCPIEWLLNEEFQHSPKQLDHDYRIDVLSKNLIKIKQLGDQSNGMNEWGVPTFAKITRSDRIEARNR